MVYPVNYLNSYNSFGAYNPTNNWNGYNGFGNSATDLGDYNQLGNYPKFNYNNVGYDTFGNNNVYYQNYPAFTGNEQQQYLKLKDTGAKNANENKNNDKKGLSDGEKFGIGALAVTVVSAIAFFALRGKGGTKAINDVTKEGSKASKGASSTVTHGTEEGAKKATVETAQSTGSITNKTPAPKATKPKKQRIVNSSMPEYKYTKSDKAAPNYQYWFVQPREFAPHSYKPEDIPKINITSRSPFVDYTTWTIENGIQVHGGGRQYFEPFDYLKLSEITESGKTILAIGKNSKGEKTVWLQAKAGRCDNGGRPIRTQYVMTAPAGQDFNAVQKDLIKGIQGRSQEELAKETPLARSAEKFVYNPEVANLRCKEDILFNQDTLLREVNHFAQGREFSPEILEKLKNVDSMKNGEYIRLV